MTNGHQLELTATDGKQRLTDVATAETLLRLLWMWKMKGNLVKALEAYE